MVHLQTSMKNMKNMKSMKSMKSMTYSDILATFTEPLEDRKREQRRDRRREQRRDRRREQTLRGLEHIKGH